MIIVIPALGYHNPHLCLLVVVQATSPFIIIIITIMIVIVYLLFSNSTSSIMHIGLSGRGSINSNIACEHFSAA